MMIDINWSGGLVLGIVHTDDCLVETGEDEFQICSAVIIHLGFFNVAILFS